MPTSSIHSEAADRENDTPNEPLRILLVITSLETGGAEKCLVNLATRMDRQRFDPQVVSLLAEPSAAKAALVNQLRDSGVAVHFLGLKSAASLPRAIFRLRKLIRKQQPDLIQSFLFHANCLTGFALRFGRNIPHVAGIRVAEPRAIRHRIERLACRTTKRFVCVSKSVELFSAGIAHLPADRLMTITNGIDVEQLDKTVTTGRDELGIASDRRLFAFVGRLHQQKGLADLFNQLPNLFDKQSEFDFLLVGDGPLRSELERLANALEISNRVHFCGWRSDAISILSACEILILPSHWEGMPNVVMEAMALGKPVVVFDVHGVKELLGEHPGPQQCDAKDYAKLLKNLGEIMNSPELAKQLGEQNRRRIHEDFTMEKMVSEYELLYEQILER